MAKSHTRKKESNHRHSTHHAHTPAKPSASAGIWQVLTAIFLVLFVVSVVTGGFSGKGNLDNVEETAQAVTEHLAAKGLLAPGANTDAQTAVVESLKAIEEKDNKGKQKDDATSTAETSDTVSDKLDVELYVMSQCPYGVQAENTMFAAIKELGEQNFNLQVDYISTDLGNGQFQSLHGQPETDGNIVQLCARDVDETKYLDLVLCMNENPQSIPGNWEVCAEKLDYDVEAVRNCFEGEQGKQLLSESSANSVAASASGSPTIIIDGAQYSGGRSQTDFIRSFCSAFEEQPAACSELPEPTSFDVIVLNDERCVECAAIEAQVTPSLKAIFPGMNTRTVDYLSEEGQQLYEETQVGALPAYLFDEGAQEDDNYARIEQYLLPAGDYTSLRIGASFDPTKEICTNEIDDTGNDLVDCEDPDCTGSIECREEKEQHLQVFIMSDCPYGRKAVEALKAVQDNFGDNLDFEIHYIATEQGDGFSSLHGQYEVDENIVQLCVQEHSPDAWFDYMYCRSTNGVKDIDWKNCANENSVDVDAVQTCFDGEEGADLLREDIKLAQELGISASPTWLANNKYTFSGIDAETVKMNFCQYNSDIEGCENTLSSDTGGVAQGTC